MTTIWWIKRDIRLLDNAALTAAVAHARASTGSAGQVLPLFVDEPAMRTAADTGDLHWIMVQQALAGLRKSLQAMDAELMVISGDLPVAFEQLRATVPFDRIDAEEETGTAWSFARDRAVRAWAKTAGVTLVEHPHNAVIRPLVDRSVRMRIWNERMRSEPEPVPRVPMSEALRRQAAVTRLPAAPSRSEFPATQRCDEHAGQRTLASFLTTRSVQYRNGISQPAASRFTGSRLSVHLAWGTLSLRSVFHALWQQEETLRTLRTADDAGARPQPGHLRALSAFSSRLFWHDHFAQRLEDEPAMEFHALNRAYEQLEYENDPELLKRWITGTTGVPMVDAAMRALRTTGFVNFRMRAMLVSYACHVLHLDWRAIRDPLARVMADYLPGIHVSQLQMQAGVVGINTIRIYNPGKQLLDHDPDCVFVKRFVPELRDIPCDAIRAAAASTRGTHATRATHSPPAATPAVAAAQMALFDSPGTPAALTPCVDYRTRAAIMRDRLWTIKKSEAGRAEAARVLEKHGSRLKGRRR